MALAYSVNDSCRVCASAVSCVYTKRREQTKIGKQTVLRCHSDMYFSMNISSVIRCAKSQSTSAECSAVVAVGSVFVIVVVAAVRCSGDASWQEREGNDGRNT